MPVTIHIVEGVVCPWQPESNFENAGHMGMTLGALWVPKSKHGALRFVSYQKKLTAGGTGQWLITNSPTSDPEELVAWFDGSAAPGMYAASKAVGGMELVFEAKVQDPYTVFVNAWKHWRKNYPMYP